MAEIKLAAETRTEFGKGAARRIRRADKIPAVLYGHGTDPVHVTLPGHETMMALKNSNALFSIELDGKGQLAIAKDVQRDPIRDTIEHIDLLVVNKGEKVEVEIWVHITGESAPGTIHVVESQSLTVEADATKLPESVEVSIEGLEEGAHVSAGDVNLPEGTTLVTDETHTVVTISVPRSEVAAGDEDEAGSAESTEAPAEG
ncbi:50S ribosomal protein L25/general stress protein Ctc [Cellulomonas sp. PhB143]|uniref:50S ribosomal protein L25/general stress protein Ctc n=1 Tax=Cellulomonas sp. PhB143 TaxID=2485186 RepID=UPI000F466952|nr:50S ribosomal protein L25/general stress protein Ctc [Cellulomonas sp. PhB143]ROS78686.1 large subunit ribosomal protein L25 [Cellulomonas sp. PhB143]